MINRWFAIEKKHYNLSAFTHLEPYFDGDVGVNGNLYKIRGTLMFPVSVDENSNTFKQAWIFIGENTYTESDCQRVIADIVAGKYDVLLPAEVFDFDTIRNEFKKYINRESDTLRLDDFGGRDYIGYESGYPKVNGSRLIWLAAQLPDNREQIAAVIAIQSSSTYHRSHYQKFQEHTGLIKALFSFEDIEFIEAGPNSQLRVVKAGIDLIQRANWDTAFRWLRENLEKLYYVLRAHETPLGWNFASSERFDLGADWWDTLSKWYREQQNWKCEKCGLSLENDQRFLDTHHIFGPRLTTPEDLMALCIGCHAQQPGPGHEALKRTDRYTDFMTRFRAEWCQRNCPEKHSIAAPSC